MSGGRDKTPEEFIVELHARFLRVAQGEPMQMLLALSNRDDSFLTLDAGETTKTMPAIQKRFAKLWPEEHPLSGTAAIELVTAARVRDKLLQKRVDRLVPKKVSERAFWRHYFSRVHAIMVAFDPSPGDKLACHIASLPPPRPLAERRYAPAATLQTEGEIDRERMIALVLGMTKMVTSEESLLIVAKAVADGKADIAAIMLAHQLEYMESMGIDRVLGVSLMSPHVLMARFPDDEQLMKIMKSFMQHCSQAAQIAMHTAMQRAPADAAQRKFKPAAQLQSDGPLSDRRLLELIESVEGTVADPALQQELVGVMKASRHSADAVLIRWQREYLEHCGLEQDYGVAQLRRLPLRHQAEMAARAAAAGAPAAEGAPEAEGTAQGGEDEESELGRAFAALRRMSDKLEALGREATIEVNRPTPKEIELRRFKPKDGADGLQRTGSLSREQILAFCIDAAKWLQADDSIAMLADVDEATCGPLSVSWQREYLEHLGIEEDFGCRQLALVPERFKGDREVLGAFMGFQNACMASMKAAALKRAQLLKVNADGSGEARDKPPPAAVGEGAAADGNGVPHAD